ncbi:hypothetical protein TUM4438_43970 [Shewanella sairae]|uniref:Uncharacterized protein n=1 Tax=Shewanella sairae TaxID=190310 RepID=A0ABQ4PSH4_9GAMM|nr:hypothetical protein [Shewanella sairae]MCL1132495.1 hypothetical protein [Shewanella sairae]GIU52116.1 hypothetical protein TUM4438_43970 [Shewanella sairae]
MSNDPWARNESAVFGDEQNTISKKPGPKPNLIKRKMSGFRVTDHEKKIINDTHMLVLGIDPTIVKGQSISAALMIFSKLLKEEPVKTKSMLKELIDINENINIDDANRDKQR